MAGSSTGRCYTPGPGSVEETETVTARAPRQIVRGGSGKLRFLSWLRAGFSLPQRIEEIRADTGFRTHLPMRFPRA